MLCQICKVNEASVRYSEIVDGDLTEVHVCQKCAQSGGKIAGSDFGLVGVFGAAQPKSDTAGIEASDAGLKCRSCGMSFAEVSSKGRLGCAECYATFRENLAPLVKKIHGGSQHIGKIPSGKDDSARVRARLMRYRTKLREAIEVEDYEEAARLRDLIRETEKQMVEN